MHAKGTGNPPQCSCLENLRDRGAWWAAIYGVAQSRTRLKWRSSSSSIHICVFGVVIWLLSCVQLFCDPMDCTACQAPLSMVFLRQEYWSGLPFPSPGDLSNQGLKLCLLHWQAGSLPLNHQRSLLSFLFLISYNLRHKVSQRNQDN